MIDHYDTYKILCLTHFSNNGLSTFLPTALQSSRTFTILNVLKINLQLNDIICVVFTYWSYIVDKIQYMLNSKKCFLFVAGYKLYAFIISSEFLYRFDVARRYRGRIALALQYLLQEIKILINFWILLVLIFDVFYIVLPIFNFDHDC